MTEFQQVVLAKSSKSGLGGWGAATLKGHNGPPGLSPWDPLSLGRVLAQTLLFKAPVRALLWRGCREPTEDFEGKAILGVR